MARHLSADSTNVWLNNIKVCCTTEVYLSNNQKSRKDMTLSIESQTCIDLCMKPCTILRERSDVSLGIKVTSFSYDVCCFPWSEMYHANCLSPRTSFNLEIVLMRHLTPSHFSVSLKNYIPTVASNYCKSACRSKTKRDSLAHLLFLNYFFHFHGNCILLS